MNRIKIISCEVVDDNWGRITKYSDSCDILDHLIYPLDWTDDVTFFDDMGNIYLIDDLDNKIVEVGNRVFKINTQEEIVEEIL